MALLMLIFAFTGTRSGILISQTIRSKRCGNKNPGDISLSHV